MSVTRFTYARLRSTLQQTLSRVSAIPNRHPPSSPIFESLPFIIPNLRPSSIIFFANPTSTSLSIRHLSTLRRPAGRRVDIGARARQIHNRRLWRYGLSFASVAGFIVIVLSTFQDQMVFYVTPTDAIQKFSTNPSKPRFRLGGLVLEGSLSHPSSSKEMEFVVTDLVTDILVRYEGMLPDLFREGHSVVVDGLMAPFPESDDEKRRGGRVAGKEAVTEKARRCACYFKANEVLAKHDEKYMPKEVAAAIEKNKAKIKAEGAEQNAER